MVTVVGGVLVNFYTGSFYLWGNIAIYVISYYRREGLSYDFIFMVDTVMFLGNWIGSLLGIDLFQKGYVGVTSLLTVGGTMAILGVLFASVSTSANEFVFFYGIVQGIGAGMTYMGPLIVAWEWFPSKKGLVSGLMVGGYGFSSFFFSLISTELVNPGDAKPSVYNKASDVTYFDGMVASRVPLMLQTLALIWALFAIASALMMSRREPDGSSSESQDEDSVGTDQKQKQQPST